LIALNAFGSLKGVEDLSKKEEIRAKIEMINDLLRLASDIRMALDFRYRLEETEGVVDLVVFATGERVFTKLSEADLQAIDKMISKMISNLVAKATTLAESLLTSH